jgi:aminopeptidase YwaD
VLGTVEAPVQVGVPVVGLAQVHGERIRARLAQGPLSLTLAVRAHRGLVSQNVLADQPARVRRAGARMVMVTAHYDSVIGAPGANDDASGTSLCLELARVLRDRPSAADLRFALWGSEEQGLIGSRYHVAQLDDAAAARIAAVFQNDMVATSWDPATRYWRLSVDGSDNTAVAAVGAAAERLGYRPRVSEPTARGASDHVPFFERGIASANFSWRGEVAPSQLEPSYHTPEDTVAYNISLERLQVSLELVGSAAAQVAGVR